MSTLNLLYKTYYPINENIGVVIPTVGEVLEDEDNYYGIISAFTAMPIDMMVQLDDAGIDFSTINDYELFLMLFPGLSDVDTRLVFGDLDLSEFKPDYNEKTKMLIFVNKDGVVIDRLVHDQIAATLRRIHRLEKDVRKPANEEARKFMIERARAKARRNRNRKTDSQIESLIVAMVNSKYFKYNFEETKAMTIYQFNESVKQIIKKDNYDCTMLGIYTGNIDVKKIKQDDLNWLTNK